MTYADRYRCSGCSLTFGDAAEWRRSETASVGAGHAPRDATRPSSASFSG
jgi:hypothetical protein